MLKNVLSLFKSEWYSPNNKSHPIYDVVVLSKRVYLSIILKW